MSIIYQVNIIKKIKKHYKRKLSKEEKEKNAAMWL